VARGRLEVQMDQALERRYRSLQNRPLANHLLRERDALFMFLSCPGLKATNAPSSFPRQPNWINRIRNLYSHIAPVKSDSWASAEVLHRVLHLGLTAPPQASPCPARA